MSKLVLENNDFLRQFEVIFNEKMARIEYAEQERKIFLTKLIVPEEISTSAFKDDFIKLVLDEVELPLLEATMNFVNQNQSKASQILGINRTTLRTKLKKHGLLK